VQLEVGGMHLLRLNITARPTRVHGRTQHQGTALPSSSSLLGGERHHRFSPSGFLVRGLGNFLFAPPIRASWFRVLRFMDCQSPVVGLLAVILGPESRDCSVGKILIFSLVLVLDKMHG